MFLLFATSIVDNDGAPSLANIFREFAKKFETVLLGYSGAAGETDSWKKTRGKKSRDTVPLKECCTQCLGGAAYLNSEMLYPKRNLYTMNNSDLKIR